MSSKMGLDFRYSMSRKFSMNKPAAPTTNKSKTLTRPQNPSSSPRQNKVYHPNAEEMKQVFNKFDVNRDGKISKEEFKAAASALIGKGKVVVGSDEAAKAFKAIDSDGDGFITFPEFMQMQTLGGGITKSDIDGAFQLYDLDGDGKISAEELWEVMKKLGENCSLDNCRKMVKEVDSDGDAHINSDEFMTMMTRTLKPRPLN